MSIRQFVVLTLLRVPPIRRYAQGKWRLAERLQEVEGERDAVSGEFASLRTTVGIVTAERDMLRDEVEQLGTLSKYLRTARDSALEQIQERKSAVEALCVERDELLTRVDQLRANVSEVTSERDDCLLRSKNTLMQIEALVSERQTLMLMTEHADAKTAALSLQRDAALAQIEALESERSSLVQQAQETVLKVSALSLERDAAREQGAEAKAALDGLTAERDSLLEKIKMLQQELELPRTVEVDISPNVTKSNGSFDFDDLRNRRGREPKMIFHVHVPKTAGTTVSQLFRQNGYWQMTLDDISNDFFSVIDEGRWFARVARDSHFFSGHYRLDHSIFRRIPGPHLIVTTLRHPIKRMLSYYNFSGRNPVMDYHNEIAAGRVSIVDYTEFILSVSGPQYSYFDDSGKGTYVRSGSASAEECLKNLFTKVSFFGLTERFREFSTLAGYLLGFANVLTVNSGKVTSELKNPKGVPLKTKISANEMTKLSEMLRDDLWFYNAAREEYEKRIADPKIQAVLATTVPLGRTCEQAMNRARAMLDFKEPNSTPRSSKSRKR